MARPIVIGTVTTGPSDLQIVNLWIRVPIAGAPRQLFYAAHQAGQTPAAPGDYAGADLQEVADFHNGLFRECPIFDVVDSGATQASRLARLVSLANLVSTNAGNDDTSLLAFYGSFYNGATWTPKSA